MNTLFISDLHLSNERPQLIELFIKFLTYEAVVAEQLYILGDLFEIWIGDDDILPELEPVIAALKHLAATGTPVFVMHGNRDFLLGKHFEDITGCKLLDDPTVIDLYGTKTLLSHGDTLCTDDTEYQKFRTQVRNPKWINHTLSLSAHQRRQMANSIRNESRAKSSEKAEYIMDVNQSAVIQSMSQWGVSQFIHGHTHRPKIHKLKINDTDARRIVLGDWYDVGSVLYCNNMECQIKSYSG